MWYDPFKSIIRQDEPLAMHTWFQTGGMAEFYAQPETQTQAAELVAAASEEGIMIRLLGEGSNVLIFDMDSAFRRAMQDMVPKRGLHSINK